MKMTVKELREYIRDMPDGVILEISFKEDDNKSMADANQKLLDINHEINNLKEDRKKNTATYNKIMRWADMFDACDMATQKMIVCMLIKRIDVYDGYELKIEFNFDFEQYNLGL